MDGLGTALLLGMIATAGVVLIVSVVVSAVLGRLTVVLDRRRGRRSLVGRGRGLYDGR